MTQDGAPEPAEEAFRTLPEQIADTLRHKILLGEFAPGANIPERETSADLGVSRTPLREALRILSNEGLVSIRPARSPIVANPSLQEVTDELTVQSRLEALAGELACMRATEDDIARVAELHERMVEISDTAEPTEFFATDMAFHTAVVEATHNQALIGTHRRYNARLWRARYLTSSIRRDRERVLIQHGQIARGMAARDAEETAAVLLDHLQHAIVNISDIYRKKRGKGE